MENEAGRLRAAAILLVGSVALTACGAGTTERGTSAPSTPPTTVASAAPTTTGKAEAVARIAPAPDSPAMFSGPAVDRFGSGRLGAAYTEIVEYLNQTTYNEVLLGKPTAADFEFATGYMTPSMAADYRKTVQDALRGDDAARTSLNTMSFFDIAGAGEGITRSNSGPTVTDHKIDNPQAEVGDKGRLMLTVTETAIFHVNLNGSPVQVPETKTSKFYLLPGSGGSHPWLISGLSAKWNASKPVPDAASN